MNLVIFMAYYDAALQRKQEIENNLLVLMGEIPYSRITIRDLTDNMQIARKTFYHYFHNKQACLESLMDRLILESSLSLMELTENTDLQEIYTRRLQFWMQHQAFLETVLSNNLTFLFIRRAMLHIRQEDNAIRTRLSTDTLACDEDVLYGFIAGQVCLILKWCEECFCRPMEEMVQISLRLTLEPLMKHIPE